MAKNKFRPSTYNAVVPYIYVARLKKEDISLIAIDVYVNCNQWNVFFS